MIFEIVISNGKSNPVQAQNQPLAPIQPQPAIEPQPPIQPKSSQPKIIKVPSNSSGFPFKRILILLIVLMIIVILGGAYVLNKNSIKIAKMLPSPTPTSTINPTQTSTPVATPDPTASWKTYTNSDFSFKYPDSLIKCCSISGPTNVNSTDSLITLGEFKTQPTNGSGALFNGLAVYLISMSNFDSFVTQEKETLVKNATVMTGNNTQEKGIQSQITVGGKNGISLSNYSWDKIERIYVPISSQKALVIARTEKSAGSFIDFLTILATFKFTQ